MASIGFPNAMTSLFAEGRKQSVGSLIVLVGHDAIVQCALVAALCNPAGFIDSWLTKQGKIIQVFPANITAQERALARSKSRQSVNAW
jgi:hypothetical protein